MIIITTGGPTCKRTYLSQRDLLSHIKMRHKDSINNSLATSNSMATNSVPTNSMATMNSMATNSMATMNSMATTRVQQSSMPPHIPIPPPNMQVPPPNLGIPPNVNFPPPNFLPQLQGIPPISSGVNSNLISVPIQPPVMSRLPGNQPPMLPQGNPPIMGGNPRFMMPPPNMMPPRTRPQNPQLRF